MFPTWCFESDASVLSILMGSGSQQIPIAARTPTRRHHQVQAAHWVGGYRHRLRSGTRCRLFNGGLTDLLLIPHRHPERMSSRPCEKSSLPSAITAFCQRSPLGVRFTRNRGSARMGDAGIRRCARFRGRRCRGYRSERGSDRRGQGFPTASLGLRVDVSLPDHCDQCCYTLPFVLGTDRPCMHRH